MKLKLDESLDKRGVVIYCHALLEQVNYTNVAPDVWLARSRSFSGSIREMTTEQVFKNVKALKEEGWKISVYRNE